jgi:hypothetical protein
LTLKPFLGDISRPFLRRRFRKMWVDHMLPGVEGLQDVIA